MFPFLNFTDNSSLSSRDQDIQFRYGLGNIKKGVSKVQWTSENQP